MEEKQEEKITDGNDRRIDLLEKEVQEQEQLIFSYQRENEKLYAEMKQLRVSCIFLIVVVRPIQEFRV